MSGVIIQSIGGAGGLVIARAIVRDIYGPDDSPRVLGTLITIFIVAPLISVIVGGIITDYLGWRWIFYLSTFLGLFVFLLIYFYIPMKIYTDTVTDNKQVSTIIKSYFLLIKSPVFIGYSFQGAFAPAAFIAFMAVGPYLMINELNRPATEFGVFFGIVTLFFIY